MAPTLQTHVRQKEEPMTKTKEASTTQKPGPGKQICICPNCGYSRTCLEPAICAIEICPLCGVAMTLEPRPNRVA
jgi:hypothetical protein